MDYPNFSTVSPRVATEPSLEVQLAAIAAQNVSFSYPDKPDTLQNVSLTIQPGERVAIIGPNGAGKTTLFMSICGVLKPHQGEIEVFGRSIALGEFRPEIGLVFQNPDDQLLSASVWDDVAFAPQNMGLDEAAVHERVREALHLTGTTELANRAPHHLSGGEKRMVAIAGVIAMHPRVVIYDEPSANLDLRARRRLINFLKTTTETLVISSHDLEFLLEVCDRVILMDEGKIVADGEPKTIMGDQELMEAHGMEKPHSLVPHQQPHHDRDSA
ncbi:MAG: ABC transporter ATP-binding protein [Synechococcales cyanobacterium T60_A2020_003]|nr:ABC transporter ATP-binding protein [Synechococcales cyanobacterium T60_A2020_003]